MRQGMFIPDSTSAADTLMVENAYQAEAQSMLDPCIEGPELPANVTIVQLRLLWQNFTNGIADRRLELDLVNRLAPTPAPTPTPMPTPAPEPRAPTIQDPDNFDGTQSKCTHFLTRLALIFASDPDPYNHDAAKIAYAASYLTSSPADWFELHLDKTTGTVDFDDYTAFYAVVKNAYDDPDARATVERKLLALKQGSKDCSVYHAEFATYATVLNYDNLTKRSFFIEGANQRLKDALNYQISLPKDFDVFIKICIKLDNNAYLCVPSHHPLRATSTTLPKPATSTAAGSSASSPIDLSSTNRFSIKQGPLTDAQRKYRRDNGLCLYCCNHGHFASDYPHSKKKKLNTTASTDSTASSSTAAPSDTPLIEVAKN